MSTLDPTDWSAFRALGHRMLDDMVDHLSTIREKPVWQPMPQGVREVFAVPPPVNPTAPEALYETFQTAIQPYVTGNLHPRFMGWVHGGGNPVSMLAELLTAAMNANCGGRDHVGIAVERQVITWAAELFGLPEQTSGVLLTGSSMANFVALLCARYNVLGQNGRVNGAGAARLTAYASVGAHRCVPAAMDMAGLGSANLRKIPVDSDFRMDIGALHAAIEADRKAGFIPFLITGTAGSVDVGAFDDLASIAAIARDEKLWFHVDGAFGALAALSPNRKPLTKGIEHADSVAFDFHKWAQVNYDSGCVLIRDPSIQLATFSQATNYLATAPRGLAGGAPWPCDLGPDLSRGFRALKVWMTLSAYGIDAFGRIVDDTCGLAQRLADRIRSSTHLELLAPVKLNIVCFGINGWSDSQTANLVADLQEEGKFAPSTTIINNRLAIRAAIVNHRTTAEDIDALVDEILSRLA